MSEDRELRPTLIIIAGSANDREIVKPCVRTLEGLGIKVVATSLSAHRTSQQLRQFLLEVPHHYELVICFAGKAAALPGAVLAEIYPAK